jgi:hypothetical protein
MGLMQEEPDATKAGCKRERADLIGDAAQMKRAMKQPAVTSDLIAKRCKSSCAREKTRGVQQP